MSNHSAKEYLEILQKQNATWKKILELYKEELELFSSKIREINARSNTPQPHAEIAAYETLLQLQLQALQELSKDINDRELLLAQVLKQHTLDLKTLENKAAAEFQERFFVAGQRQATLKAGFRKLAPKYI